MAYMCRHIDCKGTFDDLNFSPSASWIHCGNEDSADADRRNI